MQYTLNLKRRNNMEWLNTLINRMETKIDTSDNPELVERLVSMVSRAKMVMDKTNGYHYVR
jgi:acetolactate synthase regulatory subunit